MNHGLIYQLQLIFQGQIELNFIGVKNNHNRIKVATEYAFPLFCAPNLLILKANTTAFCTGLFNDLIEGVTNILLPEY